MSHTLHAADFKSALIILAAAALVIPLFMRLRLSSALGFILVGIALGPHALGRLPALAAVTLDRPEEITPIAELGVALLMFMIGLELSFERLALMRRLVLGLGGAQIALSTAGLAGAAMAAGLPVRPAAIAGLALAMSSTAIVLQVLAETRTLNRPAGRAAFAVLLAQDLAVVPVMMAIGQLAGAGSAWGTAAAILRALLAAAAIVALGRLVLRPVFRSVARTASPDLFMAACLLVVLATGLASALAGMSMAMGALIAGLLLAETEYRRQVELTIEPFKGLFVGVFLLSVGMQLDLGLLIAHPLAMLAALAGLLVLKAAIVAPLARRAGLAWPDAAHAALLLAPAGEFGFVILGAAQGLGLIASSLAGPALVLAALSMALIPLLARLAPRPAPRAIDPALATPPIADPAVIIAGFGRVGQTVAALLAAHRIPSLGVDHDPDHVARLRAAGHAVAYGNLDRPDLLDHLGLATARALIVTIDGQAAAQALVQRARAARPDLLIVARARDAAHAVRLYRAGATDAVPETIEASLQLSEAALVDLGIPMGLAIASIHERREQERLAIKARVPEAVDVRPLGRRRLRDAQRR